MLFLHLHRRPYNNCGNASGIKVWADYLFPILDGPQEDVQFPISDDNIHQEMMYSAHEDIVLEEDDKIYEKGDRFKSFHCQAKHLYLKKLSSPASCQFG